MRAGGPASPPAGGGPARDEVGRQADRAGPRPAADEPLEEPARSPRAAWRRSCTSTPVHAPEPLDASRGSCSFSTRSSVRRQGTYAVVSQPSSGSSKSLVRKTASSRWSSRPRGPRPPPSRSWQRPVVELADGLRRDPVVREVVERPGDLEQPGVLDGVVDPVEVARPGCCGPGLRGRARAPTSGRRHPRRVGELGIVVVAEDLVEVPRGGPVGSMCECGSKIGQRAISSNSSRAAGSCGELGVRAGIVMGDSKGLNRGVSNRSRLDSSASI